MTDYAFETDVQVRYADRDTLGHVNNAVFATFLEEARIAYYREVLGLSLTDHSLVVANLTIDFERPVEADEVTVGTGVEAVGGTSFTMGYEVAAEGETAATGETVMVTLDRATGQPQPVPDRWREAFEAAGAVER